MTWNVSQGLAPQLGPTTGISLNAVQVETSADPTNAAGNDGVELGKSDISTPYYQDAYESVASNADAGSAGGAALAELRDAPPPVDLSGVLPSSNPLLGSGGLQGGGVGSAASVASASRAARRGLPGGYTRTGVFGAVGEGQKFVYVFDRSGSMDGHGGAPLRAAKAELMASLRDLGSAQQFQIIFYNEQPHAFTLPGAPGRLVFGSDQNKRLAERFVGGVTADGATRHEDALMMALRLVPDVIFFLTDADEPRLSVKQLAEISRRNRGSAIHTIEFGYGVQVDRDNFLARLAQQNGGRHVYVDVSDLIGR
jgi:hypothetical protein